MRVAATTRLLIALLVTAFIYAAPIVANAAAYNPQNTSVAANIKTVDLEATDSARGVKIPALVYLPVTRVPAPVILFSHGLGGARDGYYGYLGQNWAKHGYVAVFLQHAGSDENIWKDQGRIKAFFAMKQAASAKNLISRVMDVKAVLDNLDAWNTAEGSPLFGRLDTAHIGMAGHSFGAITTQMVSGQTVDGESKLTDPRIKAALALSPSPPQRGDATSAFSSVALPWMVMTGTQDTSPIGNMSAEKRLEVYKALPAGNKYQLVLFAAQHSAFTERMLSAKGETRNPNHHPAIMAISNAFWDAYLKGDADAKAWLQKDAALQLLARGDVWEHK